MRCLNQIIDNSLKAGKVQAKKLWQEIDALKDYSAKQREQTKFFGITRKGLSGLKSNKEILEGINFANTAYCFEKFLREKTEISSAVNLERDRWDYSAPNPMTCRLEIEADVFINIWTEVTVFFKYSGEPFCASIKPNGFRDGEHALILTARSADALQNFLQEFCDYRYKHHYLKGKKIFGINGQILSVKHYGWNDVVLPEGMAERMFDEIRTVLRCASVFTCYGLNSKKGFIFAGEPGNGKTLLIKILANTIDATCIVVPCKEVGDAQKLFKLARELAPTLLILEDLDLYAKDREETENATVLGELMNAMDGVIDNQEIIVIATTNRLKKIEKALQNRPGRFDRVYTVPNPDLAARRRLLSLFIEKVPNEITPENVETLAEKFAGYSAAYLKELINSGFGQAILKDDKNPVMRMTDLIACSEILQKREERRSIGYSGAEKLDQPRG